MTTQESQFVINSRNPVVGHLKILSSDPASAGYLSEESDENGTFFNTDDRSKALKVAFTPSGGLNKIEVVGRGTVLYAYDDYVPMDSATHGSADLRAGGEYQGRLRQRLWSINPIDGYVLPIWEGDPTYVLQVVVNIPSHRILLVRDYTPFSKHYSPGKYNRAMFVFEPLAL